MIPSYQITKVFGLSAFSEWNLFLSMRLPLHFSSDARLTIRIFGSMSKEMVVRSSLDFEKRYVIFVDFCHLVFSRRLFLMPGLYNRTIRQCRGILCRLQLTFVTWWVTARRRGWDCWLFRSEWANNTIGFYNIRNIVLHRTFDDGFGVRVDDDRFFVRMPVETESLFHASSSHGNDRRRVL